MPNLPFVQTGPVSRKGCLPQQEQPSGKPSMTDIDPSLLETDPESGLSSDEVARRRLEFGLNRIETREESWLARLAKRFWGPIPWMIEVAAILSASVQRWEDFTIIMVMLMVNAFVDFYQESKALNAIAVLKQKLALQSLVRRDGEWQQLPAAELVPGDVIKIKIGDVIPADIRLLGDGDFLQIDQSALTGESLLVNRKPGEEAYANSVVKQGEMLAIVTGTGLHTYFGKTVGLVARAQMEGRSHFKRMVIKVGNFLILLTMVMITIIVYLGIQRQEPLTELLIFSLVLTISAIPVAMPTVLTVTMAIGAIALSRKQAIVSRLDAIEELAGMDILCSDKTGTLTQNRMSAAPAYVTDNFNEDDLFLYAALASRAENQDPIEQPIFEMAEQHGLKIRLNNYRLKKFVPFDPVAKRTEAMLITNDGQELIVTKGAPQVIVDLCHNHDMDKQVALDKVNSFAQRGFRTLGVAFRSTDEDTYTFVGLIPLFDPPREDSSHTIADARAKGVVTKMVTGDNLAVARYIAKLLGIGENIEDIRELKGENTEEYLLLAKVISRALLKTIDTDISREQLQGTVERIVDQVRKELNTMVLPPGTIKKHESEIIAQIEAADGFAQVYPEDKYFIVDKLQKAGHIVGMTGDGVNDAPALKKADVGIAVSGATDAARAAADIVLMAPGLRVIVDAIKLARITFERMQSYTIFRIAETIRIIIFMSLAIGLFQFYPVTALMIIMLALLNDIPILAIAYDNTRVREQPVRWNMHQVLVMSSWLGLAGVLSSFLLFWIMMAYMKMPLDFVQSVFFSKLIVAGHGTIYNTRVDDWFFKRPYPSWILVIATFASAVTGTVIAVYGFGLMTPIGWEWGLATWIYALAWFVFNDAVKMAVLRFYHHLKGVEVEI
jgi:H+-transporting ATPase